MSISDTATMFYNAKPHIFENAKFLRKNMTVSEQKLWEFLRGKKILGLRFRPQHPIDILIEVDGEIHKVKCQKEYDTGREAELNELGIQVVHFYNEEIDNDINQVINKIERICIQRKSNLQSPLQRI